MSQIVLAVDIGNVLLDGERCDREVDGAVKSLRRMADAGLRDRISLVSKCGERMRAVRMRRLREIEFFARTGVREDRVYFCDKRWEKAPISAGLGVTDFVDDKLEVLSYLHKDIRKFLFRPNQREMLKHFEHLRNVIVVWDWSDIEAIIMRAAV